jgi:hypothetical protein
MDRGHLWRCIARAPGAAFRWLTSAAAICPVAPAAMADAAAAAALVAVAVFIFHHGAAKPATGSVNLVPRAYGLEELRCAVLPATRVLEFPDVDVLRGELYVLPYTGKYPSRPGPDADPVMPVGPPTPIDATKCIVLVPDAGALGALWGTLRSQRRAPEPLDARAARSLPRCVP